MPGIAGEVESPVMGHFGSMTTTLTWRTIEKSATLAKPGSHALEVRGSEQVYDAANGVYSTVPIRCSMRVSPKNISLGSLEPGSTTDSEQEFEVTYLKLEVNKKEVVEIDKYNYIARFDGVDVFGESPRRPRLDLKISCKQTEREAAALLFL